MGATIAIGIKAADKSFTTMVMKLAEESEYGVVLGLEGAEEDVRQGLAEISECFSFDHLFLLRAPHNASVALARGIEDELSDWVVNDEYPEFARFVERLGNLVAGANEDHYITICFSAEWYAGDRVRLYEGNADSLLSILRPYGTWCQRLFVPASGGWQNVDEVPLVFRFSAGKTGHTPFLKC